MIGTPAMLSIVVVVLMVAALAAFYIRELKMRHRVLLEKVRDELAQAHQDELDAWRKKHENQRAELERLGEHRVELLIIQVDALRCNLARITCELEAVKAKRAKRDKLGKFVKK